MIVINGCVSKEIKQRLLNGEGVPPSRRHGNIIVAGGIFTDGNLWDSTNNKIEQGNLTDDTNMYRVRVAGYITVKPNEVYAISTNLARVIITQYDANEQQIGGNTGWQALPYTLTTDANCKYIRLVFAKANDAYIVPSDLEWLHIVEAVGA